MTQEEYNILIEQSQPHEVFKKDWKTYYSLDFADTFLPKTKAYNGKGTRIYDGANLFKESKPTERNVLSLKNDNSLINIIGYTYPKDVLASTNYKKILPADHEICMSAEVSKDDKVNLSFKYGKQFDDFLSKNEILKNTEYKTTISNFKENFNNKITHRSLLNFILKSNGVDQLKLNRINYSQIFTPQLLSFLETFRINGKYKVKLFIAESYKEVRDKAIEPKQRYEEYIAKPDEIHLWLINKPNKGLVNDYIEIFFGLNVAKDFEAKHINLEDIKATIKSFLKDEKIIQFIENKIIDKEIYSSLAKIIYVNKMKEKMDKNPSSKEVFKSSQLVFHVLEGLGLLSDYIKAFKLESKYWDKTDHEYSPLIGNSIENAFLCGVLNGVIDELAAIPEAVSMFFTLVHSDTAYNEFKDSIKKLLEEENLLALLLEGALKKYEESENPEEFAYHFGHDSIQIVSLILGLFQLAKGVSSFLNITKKGVQFLKRYGKDGLDNLKTLDQKQIKEVFDDLDEQKPIKIRLKVKKMRSQFLGEETGINPSNGKKSWCSPDIVKYLDEYERLKVKIKIENGKLYDNNGELFDTSKANSLHSNDGKAIFVMDENGFLYASKYQARGEFHHSSFLSGKPVSGAGEIKVTKGVIQEITNSSGHYWPDKKLNSQVVKVLKEQNVNTSRIKITNEF